MLISLALCAFSQIERLGMQNLKYLKVCRIQKDTMEINFDENNTFGYGEDRMQLPELEELIIDDIGIYTWSQIAENSSRILNFYYPHDHSCYIQLSLSGTQDTRNEMSQG